MDYCYQLQLQPEQPRKALYLTRQHDLQSLLILLASLLDRLSLVFNLSLRFRSVAVIFRRLPSTYHFPQLTNISIYEYIGDWPVFRTC